MNKKIILGIAIVAVVVILVTSYLVETRSTLNIKPEDESVDATSNWKTYESEKYGFEFKYPIDVFVKLDNDKDLNDDSQELINLRSIKNYKCGSSFDTISLSIVNSSLGEVAPKDSEQGTYFGKNGFRYDAAGGSGSVAIYYIEISDTQTLVVTGGTTCRIEPNGQEATIDDVISTIKFRN